MVMASDDEERLMMDVFRGYNSLILPIRNDSQPIIVRMTMQLVLLISVDEKDQASHCQIKFHPSLSLV
jgi:nicotinic acetylcholine receptor